MARLLAAVLTESSDAPLQYLRAARVITADTQDPIVDGVVAIQAGRIQRVGRAQDFGSALTDRPTTSYPGGTILPGLVDAHAHLTLAGDGRSYSDMNEDRDELLALVALRNMQRHLACGVTTIRDNGGRNRVTFAVREAVQRGYAKGPRLLLAGRPVTPPNGHFHWCNGVAEGVTGIREAVRCLVNEGADHIKFMASGGGTEGTVAHNPSYTATELRAGVDVAHELGRLTTAHCHARQSIVNALDAGLDCIEHATFLVAPPANAAAPRVRGVTLQGAVVSYDSRIAERIAAAGVYIGFTFAGGYAPLRRLRAGLDSELSIEERATLRAAEEHVSRKLNLFRTLVQDGLLSHLVASSDAGPGDNEFGEMWLNADLAVQAGLSSRQAIEAVTRIAAESCGIGDQSGTLAPGKVADILVVEGDPLHDITQLSQVAAVYLAGTRVIDARPSASYAST